MGRVLGEMIKWIIKVDFCWSWDGCSERMVQTPSTEAVYLEIAKSEDTESLNQYIPAAQRWSSSTVDFKDVHRHNDSVIFNCWYQQWRLDWTKAAKPKAKTKLRTFKERNLNYIQWNNTTGLKPCKTNRMRKHQINCCKKQRQTCWVSLEKRSDRKTIHGKHDVLLYLHHP